MIVGSHEGLADYYRTNFILIHEYKYSLTELEGMLPWERDIYLGLLAQKVKENAAKNG